MRKLLLSAALIGLSLVSCKRDDKAAPPLKPVVFVSIQPHAFFVERIAGGHVDVDVLVAPGRNPHAYEPTPRQMVRLAQAKTLFTVGMPFEEVLLPRLGSAAQLRLVDTRSGIDLIRGGECCEHHEDEHGDHHHGDEPDPHVWMSPRLAKVQARTIGRALMEIAPAHGPDFERNLSALEADLDALDARVAAALAPVKGRTFYVFHAAFGYFARDYGLVQEAVEVGGKTPGPRRVRDLIDKAKADGVRVIFVQPQFSDQAAKSIADQIGGAVVPIDTLAHDYIANMSAVADRISRALSPASTTQPSTGGR